MTEKIIEEQNELIAKRVPPGDSWELTIDKAKVITGLVATLTAYMQKTQFKESN